MSITDTTTQDPVARVCEQLIAAGQFELAAKTALKAQGSPPAPGAPATPGVAPATAAPAPGELVEGVDYYSHAQLSAMTKEQMAAARSTPEGRAKVDESMRHLTTSTRGRQYRA